MQQLLLVFNIFLLLFPFKTNAQENCDLRKDDSGIQVYLCDSEMSSFRTIMVDLEIPATLSQYAAMVLDVDHYSSWQYKINDIRVLKQVSPTEFYYYSEVTTPWPTSNRDMIFHCKLWQDSTTKVLYVSLTAMPDFVPKKSGIVRIPQGHSLLTVTPIDKTHVQVHYVIDIDPGGFVPPIIANMFAAQAPWETYKNFRECIIEQGYERNSTPLVEDF